MSEFNRDSIKDLVFIMSEETWEAIKEEEYEFANTQPDPIKYISEALDINVVTDNSLPFPIVEMWTVENYNKFLEENE